MARALSFALLVALLVAATGPAGSGGVRESAADPAPPVSADDRLISRKDLLWMYIPGSSAAIKAQMKARYDGDPRLPTLLKEIAGLDAQWNKGTVARKKLGDELLGLLAQPSRAKPPRAEGEIVGGFVYEVNALPLHRVDVTQQNFTDATKVKGTDRPEGALVAADFAIASAESGLMDSLDDDARSQFQREAFNLSVALGFIRKDGWVYSAAGNARVFGADLVFTRTPFPSSATERSTFFARIRNEVDAGRPVQMRVRGHAEVIYGYRLNTGGDPTAETSYDYLLHDVGDQGDVRLDSSGQVYKLDEEGNVLANPGRTLERIGRMNAD